jgi:hypothetical protein
MRAELFGDVADLGDRADVAVHRVDAFEGHQLRRGRVVGRQSSARCFGIIVAEDPLLGREWRMPSIIEAWLSASE